MTNLAFILKLLRDGEKDTHIKIIDMLINCISNYDEIEYWTMNYRWLFEETPENIKKLLQGGPNVQLRENQTDVETRHDDPLS